MNIRTWLLAGALALTGCHKSGSSSSSSSSSVPQLTQRAGAIVAQGRLAPNKEGVVDLPETMKGASVDNKAYVKKGPGGEVWVLLLSTQESPTNFKAHLYCTQPPAQQPTKVQVLGPKGPVQVTVDSASPDGWYEVHAG
jgi:hypothetical protein